MKKLEWFLSSITGVVTGFKITDIKEDEDGYPCIVVNGIDDYIDFDTNYL